MAKRMQDVVYTGTWDLVGAATYRDQLDTGPFVHVPGKPWNHGVVHWLQGRGSAFPGERVDASGVTLIIDEAHRFTQQAQSTPALPWVDVDGVVLSAVPCFSGAVFRDSSGAYLVADGVARSSDAADRPYGVLLRYDDGDTRVCDRLERLRNTLTRTINLVTDDMYFERTVLSYAKRKGS